MQSLCRGNSGNNRAGNVKLEMRIAKQELQEKNKKSENEK